MFDENLTGKQLIQSLVLAGFQGPGGGHTVMRFDGRVIVALVLQISLCAFSFSKSFWVANMKDAETNLKKQRHEMLLKATSNPGNFSLKNVIVSMAIKKS